MSDFADLGMRIHSESADTAEKRLDRLAQAADRADEANDKLAESSKRSGGAIAQMLASIERSVGQLAALTAAQQSAAAATARQAKEAQEAARSAAELERRVSALKASTDPLGAAIDRVNKELDEADALYKAGAISAADFAQANTVLSGRLNRLQDEHAKVRKATGLSTAETLNFSRQLADVGVSAAMGMNPLMILIQQGPQIADVFATAASRGVGFRAALAGIAGAAGPLAPALAAVAAVAGVAFGGAALAARALNKENGDLTKGMGLTEKQLERLKEKGVNTGVTIGDVFRGTFNYIAKGVGEALAPVGRWFSKLFDEITRMAYEAAKRLVGALVGGFEAIRATWRMFPAAFGDVVISGVNLAIGAVEKLINFVTDGINRLIGKANEVSARMGGPQLGQLGSVTLGRVANPFQGFAAAAMQAGQTAFAEGDARGQGWVDRQARNLAASIRSAAEARIRKEAGKAEKGRRATDPRDQTDERTAQIDAALAQARADELQAQLGIVRDLSARARIEKEILAAQTEAKQAQVDRQIANIADDKGLTEAKKAELSAQLEVVKQVNDRAAALQMRRIDEEAADAIAKELREVANARRHGELELLSLQSGLARTAGERRELELRLLELAERRARAEAEGVLASKTATDAQKEIARIQLQTLEATRGARRQGVLNATMGPMEAYLDSLPRTIKEINEALEHATVNGVRNLEDALYDLADGSARVGDVLRDISRATVRDLGGIANAIKSVKAQWQAGGMTGKIGAAATAAQIGGSMIGGTAGSVLGGMGAGAMIGMQFGGPIGAAIGAALGGIAGAITGGNQKREEKRARDAQQMEQARQQAAQVTQQRQQLELALIEASGDATEALAARRKLELEAMDASLRALQQQVWARQDAAQREASRRALEIQLLDLTGDSVGALALQRAEELKGVDATLRALQQAVWKVADARGDLDKATAGVGTARDALIDTYKRESDAILDAKRKWEGFAESMAAASRQLSTTATGGLNPLQQYRATGAEFDRVFAAAMNKDEGAIGRLPGVIQAWLEASRGVATNGGAYGRDVQRAQQALSEVERLTRSEASAAQKQLDALNEIMDRADGVLDGVVNLGETTLVMKDGVFQTAANVMTTTQAVQNLGAAMAAQAVAQANYAAAVQGALGELASAVAEAQKPQGPAASGYTAAGWAGYVQGNPDLAAAFAAGTGMARGHSIEEFAQLHWARYGQYENRQVRPFARGGFHAGGLRLVGEEGPEIEATGPARYYSADRTRDLLQADNGRLEALVEVLTQRVEALSRHAEKTASAVDDLNKTGVWARGQRPGDAVATEAA